MTRLLTISSVLSLCLLAALGVTACSKSDAPQVGGAGAGANGSGSSAAPPTNRVDIPAAVQRSLGITFARVEPRPVAKTLRVAGRFELLPTARREYRAPMKGRVDLLVKQYDTVAAGTPLFRVESAAWHDLHERLVRNLKRHCRVSYDNTKVSHTAGK